MIICKILFTQGSHNCKGLWLELRHYEGGPRDDYVLEWVVRGGPYRASHYPCYDVIGRGTEVLNLQLRDYNKEACAIRLAIQKYDELERRLEETK